MRKIISLLLAVITALSCGVMATGCSAPSTVTQIYLLNFDGGVGSEWLEADVAEFTELVKEKSYEDGKTGVKFRIDRTMGLSPATMNTTGYHIYFDEAQTDVRALATNGYLVDLTEIVTTPLTEYEDSRTIAEKIDTTYSSKLKGNDGKWYGLPYYEWYPGIIYDLDNFEQYHLYIADNSVADSLVDTVTRFGQTVRFLKNGRIVANRSCGNDGIKGTEDDGLPTTLIEFMSMCQRMVNKGVTPFQTSGMYQAYTNYLLEAIWGSLAGYDKMRAYYDLSGEIEVVKRDAEDNLVFTDEPLFTGLVGKGNDGAGKLVEGNYIMKPETEIITLNAENGYRAKDMVERYYSTAFLEIAQREGWFSEDSTTSSISHTDAQENFIFNGRTYGVTKKETCGMLIEGAYWYQESQRTGALDDYFMEVGKDKPLGWMSLPTALGLNGESVTSEANAREVALLETSQSFVTLNKTAFKNKDGVLQACLDFVRFMYSDARLRSFTRITGIAKGGMYYDLEDEDLETMNEYQQSVWALRSKNKVVLAGSNEPAYIARQKKIDINSLMGLWTPTVLGTKYGSYVQAIRKDSKNLINAQNIFSETCVKQSAW